MELPAELSSRLLAQIQAKGRQPAPSQLLETTLLLPDYTLLPPGSRGNFSGGACPEEGRLASIQLSRPRAEGSECVPKFEEGGFGQSTLGIEIKPKCGCLPVAATIHPVNSIKKQKSRFALHQRLKLDQVTPLSVSPQVCGMYHTPIPERCPLSLRIDRSIGRCIFEGSTTQVCAVS